MVNMTLAIPGDLKKKMEVFQEINWSEVARQAFLKKAEDMEFSKRTREAWKEIDNGNSKKMSVKDFIKEIRSLKK